MIFSIQRVNSFPGRSRKTGENVRNAVKGVISSMNVGDVIAVKMNGCKIETFNRSMYKAARDVGYKISGCVVKEENCVYIKREA